MTFTLIGTFWCKPPMPNLVEIRSLDSEMKQANRHDCHLCVHFMRFIHKTHINKSPYGTFGGSYFSLNFSGGHRAFD